MSTAKKEFNAAIPGYHHSKKYWNPKPSEKLFCCHETDNPFDVFAIKACNTEGNTVGHLPRELSRVTKFILIEVLILLLFLLKRITLLVKIPSVKSDEFLPW